MSVTYQIVPFLDIIDGMDTDIKVPHDGEDLNPEWQMCCEELVDRLVYFPRIRATTRDLHKMFCPELTGILQSISNTLLPVSRHIAETAEITNAIKVTDVPLQPLFHQMET